MGTSNARVKKSPASNGTNGTHRGASHAATVSKVAHGPGTAFAASDAPLGAFYAAGPLLSLSTALQAQFTVGEVGDPFEREADAVADRVTAGQVAPPLSPLPPGGLGGRAQAQPEEEPVQQQAAEEEEPIQQQAAEEEEPVQQQATEEEEPVQQQTAEEEEPVQQQAAEEEEPVQQQAAEEEKPIRRNGPGQPGLSAATAATIRSPGSGIPMPASVRQRIEPRVGADLSGVRVHTGPSAQRAASSLDARAFTHDRHIFLSRAESSGNLRLMAHEAAHVVQQRAVPIYHQPQAAAAPAQVQRLPALVTERLASYARHIPGYTLLTVILGFNPLTGEGVERNAMNLVEGVMGLVPFGTAIFDKLRELGILQDAFDFVERQLANFNLSLERVERTIEAAWEEMDFIRLDPFDYNLAVLIRHFQALVDDVRGFASSLVGAIIDMIKEAVIGVVEGLLAENRAWALIKKVLHYDPLRDEPVDASTVEILEDFMTLIGKQQELEQMRVRGTLQRTADWLDTQLDTFRGLLTQLGALFSAAWQAIQPENLPNLMSNLQSLAGQALGFLQQVWDFASTVAREVLRLIKDALLSWLSSFAEEIPGFHLLTVIIERNPFTGERVPRTAENLIRGFITLLPNGAAIYERLAESGAIAGAAARIEGAMSALNISWEFIVGLFTGLWESLSIDDLIDPIGAFQRIVAQFGEPIARLFAFIGTVLRELFFLILEMMNFPTDLIGSIISNAMQAIEDIKRDPVGFLLNMLRAVKQGFTNFFDNILTHLLGGLADWLFRGLRDAGIEPPTDLSLQSVLGFVLQVLGLSMDRIWEKLAERIGQETVDRIRGAIDRLTGIWNFVRDVQERGIVAIWEYIESQISNLWNLILDKARDWIMERIINRAIQWLLSLLDPTGIMPVINSFMAFFRAVQSAIDYLRDILAIINQYVATIASIARGAIEPGAQMLEQGLANAIPIVIGFLANQFGLGNIGEKIQEIVAGIREVVDRALDWLLDRAVQMGRSVLRMLGLGGREGEGTEGTQAGEDVDPANHPAYARHAADMLKRAPLTEGASARSTAEQFAAEHEPALSRHLGEGMRLRYVFRDQAADAADQAIHFQVVIAPNDTTVTDEIPVSEDPCYAPRASAPGIGNIARHGAQGSSLRDREKIWWIESEHVLPFATGRTLWEGLRLYLPERGWPEDTQQTTIMIYYGAARIKTPRDNEISRQFSNAVAALDINGAFQSARERYEAGEMSALSSGREVLGHVLGALNRAKADAVTRTNAAITQEHAHKEEGCPETNGQRRAEAAPLPIPDCVAAAAGQQYDDVLGLVTEEVLSREELRQKMDRILGR